MAESGLRLVGPNCEGVLNNAVGLDVTFAAHSPSLGNIAFVSQSGALGANTIFRWASERGIGISMFASVGNEADLCSNDFLEYFGNDPGTTVVMVYMEGAIRIEHGASGTLKEHLEPRVTVHTANVLGCDNCLPYDTCAVGGDLEQDLHLIEVEHPGIGAPAAPD